MYYVFAAAAVIALMVVAVAIWRRRAAEANSALQRVDAYIDNGKILSRLADACNTAR